MAGVENIDLTHLVTQVQLNYLSILLYLDLLLSTVLFYGTITAATAHALLLEDEGDS